MTKFATTMGGFPLPVSAFQSIQGYNDFNPNTNFHQPITAATKKANQNGVVLIPRQCAHCTKTRQVVGFGVTLIGGLGVSDGGVPGR